MKIFISWSGPSSQATAELLADALPVIIQSVRPFISVEDLRKGGRWQSELADELRNTSVGVICMTRSNLEAPWILFEAGALSKVLEESCVMPLLIGLTPSDIRPPLSQFNVTRFEKIDFFRLVKTINDRLPEPLSEKVLQRAFDQAWPSLEESIQQIIQQEIALGVQNDIPPDDPIEVMSRSIDEILSLVRSQTSALNQAHDMSKSISASRVDPSTWAIPLAKLGEADATLSVPTKVIIELEQRRRSILTSLYMLENLANKAPANSPLGLQLAAIAKGLNRNILPIFRQFLGSPSEELRYSPKNAIETGVDSAPFDETA